VTDYFLVEDDFRYESGQVHSTATTNHAPKVTPHSLKLDTRFNLD
jgi:hypothetical protein